MIHETAIIDKGAIIGQNCFIQGKIGNNCRIQNNVSVYKKVVLKNNVFCGPSCVFTNVLFPRAGIKGTYLETIIEDNVTIGANAVIRCGITLGKNCFIGAGSVVLNNDTISSR